jgi:glycine cleavage system aminomethyltransferase T
MPQLPKDHFLSYTHFGPAGRLYPYECAGWVSESLSWKETAYIHAGLSDLFSTVDVSGPDMFKMFSRIAVNDLSNFDVGRGRHIIMCNEKGNIMEHGLSMRIDEKTIRTFDLSPYMEWVAKKNGYNVTFENVDPKRFIYQIGGPKSLEIIENAAKQDIHDLKFMRFTKVRIAGHDVLVIRMGMGGTLSYEVQGTIEDSHDVYDALWKAGKSYGLRKLGILTYVSNHTENGYPQHGGHFPLAWAEDEAFAAWIKANTPPFYNNVNSVPVGTYTQEQSKIFHDPIELGWKNMVSFNHDFIGKATLEKIVANPKRIVTTLKWNKEDIVDIYRSWLEPGEPYKRLEFPVDFFIKGPTGNYWSYDMVQKNGKEIGSATWQVYTPYYRDVISMGFIDIDQNVIGNECILLWGERGKRIKEVRVTVERYPYLDLTANVNFDVEAISHYKG